MKSIKCLIVFCLAAIAIANAGCGVGTTERDSVRAINRTADYDAHMLVDDLGLLFQVDRPWRGSRWGVE